MTTRGIRVTRYNYVTNSEEEGLTTGVTQRCREFGCDAQRIWVKWSDGKVTKPCEKELTLQDDGSYRVL